jgi:hypothetical protein
MQTNLAKCLVITIKWQKWCFEEIAFDDQSKLCHYCFQRQSKFFIFMYLYTKFVVFTRTDVMLGHESMQK